MVVSHTLKNSMSLLWNFRYSLIFGNLPYFLVSNNFSSDTHTRYKIISFLSARSFQASSQLGSRYCEVTGAIGLSIYPRLTPSVANSGYPDLFFLKSPIRLSYGELRNGFCHGLWNNSARERKRALLSPGVVILLKVGHSGIIRRPRPVIEAKMRFDSREGKCRYVREGGG